MKKCTAVVGCGIWGRNIVRNFYNLGALHSVCDLDLENLKMIQELYPEVNTTSDFNSIISNPEITAKIDKYSNEVKEILDEDWRNNLWMTIFPLEGEYYIDRDTFCSKEPPKHKCTGQCAGCGGAK